MGGGPVYNFIVAGLIVLGTTFVGLWLCLPGKDGEMKPFLRGGLHTWAGIAVTAGFGLGISIIIAGLASFLN
jgi:hypothetical protein